LRIKATRNAAGSNWTTASTKLLQVIDVTEQAYIEYNPDGANYGMAFGGNNGSGTNIEWARFLSTGNLGIGRTNPSSKLEVLGTIAAYSADITSVGSFAISNAGLCDITAYKSTGGTLRFVVADTGGVNQERGRFNSTGNLLIATSSDTGTASQKLQVTGGAYVSGSVGIGTTNPSYNLHVVGSFGATTKSFVVPHPTKPGRTLQYGSLESPYHGIRLTGKGIIENGECVIYLPEYISTFVKEDGINIQITNIKHGQILWVEEINIADNNFIIHTEETTGTYEFYWDLTAIRKDVADLVVEV
jgi:hypothetical protein